MQCHSQRYGPGMNNPARTGSRLVVLVAIGAAFMASLDLFVVNVAFDDIGLVPGRRHARVGPPAPT